MPCPLDSNFGAATGSSSPLYPFDTKQSTTTSFGQTPSKLAESGPKKPLKPLGSLPSPLAPRGSILTAPAPGFDPGLSPTHPASTDAAPVVTTSQGNATSASSMGPTNQGLRPLLPTPAHVGDPYGHQEISEPDFSATRPCSGCSPVVLITATGWLDLSAGVATSSTVGPVSPPTVTAIPTGASLSASSASIAIDPDSESADFAIGGFCTFTPGQTIIVDDTPVVIEPSKVRTAIVTGTATIPLRSYQTQSLNTLTPSPPALFPPIITIGTATLTPNAQSQYVVAGQTLTPDGKPLTISNTIISLAPSATALVVNGETSSISPVSGVIYTKVVPAVLKYNNHIYTVNRAGYIAMGQGTTLIPGGKPVTVNGTILSLEHNGTAVVIQSTTQTLEPVTTIVTLTRGLGGLETGCSIPRQPTGDVYVYPTTTPVSASGMRNHGTVLEGWLGSVILLMWCGISTFVLRI